MGEGGREGGGGGEGGGERERERERERVGVWKEGGTNVTFCNAAHLPLIPLLSAFIPHIVTVSTPWARLDSSFR